MNLIKIQSYNYEYTYLKYEYSKSYVIYLNLEKIKFSSVIYEHKDFTNLFLEDDYKVTVLSEDFEKLSDILLKELNFIKLFNDKKYHSGTFEQRVFINLDKISYIRKIGKNNSEDNYYDLYFTDSKADKCNYQIDEEDFNKIIKLSNLKKL